MDIGSAQIIASAIRDAFGAYVDNDPLLDRIADAIKHHSGKVEGNGNDIYLGLAEIANSGSCDEGVTGDDIETLSSQLPLFAISANPLQLVIVKYRNLLMV